MKTLADIQGSTDYYSSLVKLLDVGIADVQIGFDNQWGDLLITVYGITLVDGRMLCVQGEHDIVFLDEEGLVSSEQLELFMEEESQRE